MGVQSANARQSAFSLEHGYRRPGLAEAPAPAKREASKFWLNVGYMAGEGENTKFVSLPLGIPMDDVKLLKTTSSNEDYAHFQAARNDLYAQLMAEAEKLEPGASIVFTMEVQLRRVNDEIEAAPAANANANPYKTKLFD
jgi:hypothetical protein